MTMTREISLGKSGKFAIVDVDDYEKITRWKWQYINSGYANRVTNKGGRGKWVNVLMHRVIIDAPDDMKVDHINGNKLDNRKCNLRLATTTQNCQYKRQARNNTSGFKGVTKNSRGNTWLAHININGKPTYLGSYPDAVTAAFVYNERAEKEFGEFALLNDISAFI